LSRAAGHFISVLYSHSKLLTSPSNPTREHLRIRIEKLPFARAYRPDPICVTGSFFQIYLVVHSESNNKYGNQTNRYNQDYLSISGPLFFLCRSSTVARWWLKLLCFFLFLPSWVNLLARRWSVMDQVYMLEQIMLSRK
jgi:hypothetical protein